MRAVLPVSAVSVLATRVPGGSPLWSLEVAVQLEAVVAGVCHHDLAVVCDVQPLRAVQRIAGSVDVRQERTGTVKHLVDRDNTNNNVCTGFKTLGQQAYQDVFLFGEPTCAC